jgi:hypothetical protein
MLGRYCSCGAKGIPGPDAESLEQAYEAASDWLGYAPELHDGRIVETLHGCQDIDGVVHVIWDVRCRNEEDGDFEYMQGGFLKEEQPPDSPLSSKTR